MLTTLLQSWSVRETENESGASNYMIRKAKELVNAKGILCTPNLKPGKMV
jgi:hypothetical protein